MEGLLSNDRFLKSLNSCRGIPTTSLNILKTHPAGTDCAGLKIKMIMSVIISYLMALFAL